MKHDDAVKILAVEQYLLGEMPAAEREAFEEHYFECNICADELRSASGFIADARAIFAAEPEGAPAAVEQQPPPRTIVETRPARNWFAWLQPQTAAFALAGVMVVSLGTITTLWRQVEQLSSPRIVDTTFLHGQTRGAASEIQVAAGMPQLLKIDLPETSASRLRFLVESSDSKIVYELFQNAPPQGAQVNFLIPKLDVPAGEYRLVVRAEGANEQDLAQYPFRVR